MNKILIGILFLLLQLSTFAQNERKFIRRGNDHYMEALKDTTRLDTATFSNAETEYRKALNLKPDNYQWRFNLADALYKQGKMEEASARFEELAQEEELELNEIEKAGIHHNLGNSLLQQQKIDESIEAYKEALRNNPNDIETKYNLAFAQKMKKEQEKQQQQQNKDQNKDQDKDQNKDKNDQNKDQNKDKEKNKDQDKNQDKKDQNKDQNRDKQQQNKDKQQQQQQPKISKENAERLLQALENDEKKVQQKVKKAKAKKAKQVKTEKDW